MPDKTTSQINAPKKFSPLRLRKTHKSDHTKSDQSRRQIRTEKGNLGAFKTNASMETETFTSHQGKISLHNTVMNKIFKFHTQWLRTAAHGVEATKLTLLLFNIFVELVSPHSEVECIEQLFTDKQQFFFSCCIVVRCPPNMNGFYPPGVFFPLIVYLPAGENSSIYSVTLRPLKKIIFALQHHFCPSNTGLIHHVWYPNFFQPILVFFPLFCFLFHC